MQLPAHIGVVGCGSVSHQYLPNLLTSPNLKISAVADVEPAAAHKVAEKYGVQASSVETLIDNPEIDIVLNLTPISAHASVTRDALNAGKHVYSEKSLAMTVADAKELLATAEAKNLMIGGAPDTLLGTSFQAAREALQKGAVGKPLTAVAVMLRGQMSRLAYFEKFNALFDMAPYYVSALVSLFGPIGSVNGYVEYAPETAPQNGVAVGLSGVLEFQSGVAATLSMNWGSAHRTEIPVLDVYADSGILRFANPNNFGDPASMRRHDEPEGVWHEIPGSRQPSEWPPNLRGLGVAEMADALAKGQPPRASGQLACHVVEVIEGLAHSSQSGQRVTLTTTCQPPKPLSDDDRKSYINPERSNA